MANILPINSDFDYKKDSWQYKLKIFQKDTNKEEIINIVYNKDPVKEILYKDNYNIHVGNIQLTPKGTNLLCYNLDHVNQNDFPYWLQKEGNKLIVTANPNHIRVNHLDKVTYYSSLGLPCDPSDPDDPNLPCPPGFDPRLIDQYWNSPDKFPGEGNNYINQVITSKPSSYRTCIITHPLHSKYQLYILQTGTDNEIPDKILWRKYFTFKHKKGVKDPELMSKVFVPKAEGVDIEIMAKLYPEVSIKDKENIKMWWWYSNEGEKGNYVKTHWPDPKDKTSFYYSTKDKNLAKAAYDWHLFSKAEPELVDTEYTISGYIGYTLPKDFNLDTDI